MGDLALGARSGHDGPEERPGRPDGLPDGADGTGPEPRRQRDHAAGDGDGGDTPGDDESAGGGQPKKPRSFWKELPLLIGIALVLALLIKTFLVQAFSIPSASMMNTLKEGDRVLVDKLTPWFGSEPERGEVIVFHDPAGWLEGEPVPETNFVQKGLSWIGLMPSAEEKDLIKRVIGVGGDTVECNGTGPVRLNGKPLDEPYVMPGNTPCTVDKNGGQFKVKVPDGMLWVMGDHRQDSMDSRYHQHDKNKGFVPVDSVVGRAVVIAWPPTRWATLPVPDTFDQPGLNAALGAAPGVLGLAGAVPLALWRRKAVLKVTARPARLSGGRTAG
ncbi:signal peptidase I [Streptomyces uncialis]|uniref:signal peptidase I n=1 Tax=Streptomyces uncialis TaxID=1048205 RepID=UPI00365334CC